MNCMILKVDHNMNRSEALVIMFDKMEYNYLSEHERNQLKGENGRWFDIDKVRTYLRSNGLVPCDVIDETDETPNITYVEK